jgi:hypothetical protein
MRIMHCQVLFWLRKTESLKFPQGFLVVGCWGLGGSVASRLAAKEFMGGTEDTR